MVNLFLLVPSRKKSIDAQRRSHLAQPIAKGTSHLSTEPLITAVIQGDQAACEELYYRYYPNVVRRISYLAGPSVPVMDMVQETFIQVFKNIKRYKGTGPLLHWMLRIATNVSRSYYRRRKRCIWQLWAHGEDQEKIPSALQVVDESYPHIHAVHRALDHLSPPLREAVILFELEGLSLSELADFFEIPLHTAASRVRRGREQLRRRLEHMGFSPAFSPALALPGGEPQ